MHQVRVLGAQLAQAQADLARAIDDKRNLELVVKEINDEVLGIEQRS